ncbi:MAG TPA: hypothetical protein VHO24_03510 [Opitutaceae bacterium]|nr:hypothetical protein [Opitutaceae bacterium]
MMTRTTSFLVRFVAIATVAFVTGCTSMPTMDPAVRGPFFAPSNHGGVPMLPAALRRVVLLPVCGGTVTTPEMAEALDRVFATALLKENRFEMVVLTREECRRRFGVEELSSTSALPNDFMQKLRRDYAVDAVLFVDLTSLQAYPPLNLGVRAKLATVEDVRLLWNFDSVFSASDTTVVNSARRHFLKGSGAGAPMDLSHSVLQSPSRFGEYAAAATFATLPPVFAGVPVGEK